MEKWLQQLYDVDPLKRKQAVAALGKSLAVTAVDSLEQLAQHDPDVSVRSLAAKAIQHINSRAPQNLSMNQEPDFLKRVSRVDVSPPHKVLPSHGWLLQLLLYCIVNVIGSVLMSVLTLPQLAASVLALYADYYPQSRFAPLRDWVEAPVGQLVIAGIIVGLLSFVSSLFMLFLTHLVAVRLFRGLNSFKGMLRETLLPQSIMGVIIVITYLIVASINPLSLVSLGDNPLQFIITLIGFVVYLGTYVWLAVLLGRAYHFGTETGCVSIVIVFVVVIIFSVMLNFA